MTLMVVTVVDVTKRKYGTGGVSGALETTEVVLVAVVFAGMMSAELTKTHVRTPILTEQLPVRVAAAVRLVGLALAVAFLVWLTVLTARAGMESFRAGEYHFGKDSVLVWPAKLFIPLGLAGFAVALAADAIVTLRQLLSRSARGRDGVARGESAVKPSTTSAPTDRAYREP